MNKFNLTFNGEILAGHDPAQVRLRFANKFDIDDPVRLERFFSGDTVILRRNLERKAAAQFYHELQQLGALATLVKITDSEAEVAHTPSTPNARTNTTVTTPRRPSANESGGMSRAVASEQTWAVSSAGATGKVYGRAAKPSAVSPRVSTPATWKRDTVDVAAGIKARKLETQQQAAQKAALERAKFEEQERRTAAAAARRQAEALEHQRLIQEEAAKKEAARQDAESKRLAEEEAVRQAAIAAEAERRAAEEATRLAAEQARIREVAAEEEARRRAAEEASRREAERQQQKAEQELLKAKAAAEKIAQQDAKKRRDAEEKARRKAALAEKKRLEALETARRKAAQEEQKRRVAEEAAGRKAALEEKRRLEAEETARRMAELAAQQRHEAEEAARREAQRRLEEAEAARQQAELDELKRSEAEEEARLQAELAAITLREAEEEERLQAALDEQARQAAAQAAQIKAEAQRQLQEAQRQSAERRRAIADALAARQARQAQKRRESSAPPEQQAAQLPLQSQIVAPEAPPRPPPKRAKPRIRTALEVPPRTSHQNTQSPAPEPRKRQPGEPNVYKLRPFRNTEEVRTRAAVAQKRARHSYTLGIVAVAALLIVAGSFMQRSITATLPGARAIAVDPRAGPMLLAQATLLFHDRAGIGTGVQPVGALGLDALEPPLAFDDNGVLMAVGILNNDQGDMAAEGKRQLLRCDLPLQQCKPFSPQLVDNSIAAFAVNSVDGSVLLADRSSELLLKSDREGNIVARENAVFAEHLVMRLHSGLLLMNSATAPAISVLRYENNAFGQQLDEILLLPPGVDDLDALRVGDFLWSGGAWWVTLHHPESGHAGLFRFDEEWNFLDQITLPAGVGRRQLINWDERVLVNDPQQLAIARISALGVVEAPFLSIQLEKVSAEQQQLAVLTNLAWRGALLLSALAAALCLGLGYLHSRRALVYQPRREQGAEPLEEHVNALRWIDPVVDRQAVLRRRMTSYALIALGVVMLALASSVSVGQLTALLLVLSGPAVALLLISRRAIGHIGLLGDQLLLVDHNGTYHLAGGSRVKYRGPFLSIDDVVVYCGGRFLPAFSPPQIQQWVRPLALGGVKVDGDTIMVKLLQSRHPLALCVLAIAAAMALASAVLYL